jgi:hypothetical protein
MNAFEELFYFIHNINLKQKVGPSKRQAIITYLVTVESTTAVVESAATTVESTATAVESVDVASVEALPHATNVAIAKIAITFFIM